MRWKKNNFLGGSHASLAYASHKSSMQIKTVERIELMASNKVKVKLSLCLVT
jgi:hypothetical protein